MRVAVLIHEEKDGFWAEVPDLPGCYSQGDTLEELVRNIKEAIVGFLDIPEQEIGMPPASNTNPIGAGSLVEIAV